MSIAQPANACRAVSGRVVQHRAAPARGSRPNHVFCSTPSSKPCAQAGCDKQAAACPPPLRQENEQQPLARRGVLALAAAAVAAAGPGAGPAAVQAAPIVAAPGVAAAPAAVLTPLPVPPLTETYMSKEGFAFDYPAGWVVAFDRSGSSGNGAVIVVGDFRQLITVSVFRTETIPELLVQQGLTEESGYAVCVEPQQRQDSTMRFELLRSAAVPPAPGSSPPGTRGGAGGPAYEFEFNVESCAGEIEEGIGGKLRCLSFGAVIPSQRRRHVGRCVLANGRAYSLNASTTEERWAQVGPLLQAVVSTFRS